MIKPIDASGYDTDKVQMPHYLRNYEKWFEGLWDKPIVLLEVGIHKGGSLLLWRDYFQKGRIVGLDVQPIQIDDPSGRIRTYHGQQDDLQILDRIAAENAPNSFDVVIDDGSHVGRLTRATFWHLFDCHLKDGGLYVIEDWGTGYWPSWYDGNRYRGEIESPCMLQRLGLRKARKQPLFSHQHGMVGFIKQLVDECGVVDATYPVLALASRENQSSNRS